MQKSVFFRRVLALLLVALLLWALLTALLYSVLSRPVFTRIKVAELQPKAVSIANMAAQNYMQADPYFDELLDSAFDLFDVWIFVVDGLSGDIRNTTLPDESADSENEIYTQIGKNMPQLMTGDYSSLWFTGRLNQNASEMLYIGVPVYQHFGRQTSVVGAVFFVKPLKELDAGLNSMNIALLVSTLLVFILMIVPTYLATAKLVRPLRQTRDVALAMAAGNFQVRADTRQRGEIGELAATMNNLAQELSQTISALTLERNRLKQVLDGMSDGLIAVDTEGLITQTNQAAWSLLDFDNHLQPEKEQNLFSHIPDIASAFTKAMQDNQPDQCTVNRGTRIIRVQIEPLQASTGDVAGAVGLLHDITEMEHLEQTRRDYVANVSHELRSPLTAMRALIEPLHDGMVPREDDRQRYYGILLREIIRLSRLIDDMLELSRLQSGTLSMNLESFDLRGLLRELDAKYAARADDMGLELVLPKNLFQCPAVIGDPDRVEQVLVILLDNAMKFTASGGKIQILLNWNPKQVQISVEDNGIGIDQSDIPHVFDRFYKADKAHQQPGTGLGLSIAREILLHMGQTISVRSETGRGTRFTFTLAREETNDI
ncbi:MAG: ATP-binding protein [Clostridiaceae bacterium]|nr:ATP-binding protein [Clostridiaceae bacterium]